MHTAAQLSKIKKLREGYINPDILLHNYLAIFMDGNFNYKTHGLLIQFLRSAFFLPYKVHKGCLTKAI